MSSVALQTPREAAAPHRVWDGLRRGALVPVLTLTAIILAVWYLACLPMNRDLPQLARVEGLANRYEAAWSLERPVLPAPHQIITELYASTIGTRLLRETADGLVLNPRNLLTHAWVTISATLAGFVIGVTLGIALAVAIVHVNALRRSLMPWIVASQSIPILAIAPIIIVALGSVGIVGLLPKAVISAYLSFFPVTIGMVKGLTSPDAMLLDLMRTYNASGTQTFVKLRWPAAMPLLFASLKVSISISLVGAIVGELPTGAQAGIGARLLSGSYYGQTVQIWSALVMAAILAALLVALITLAEKLTLKAMGARP
ncbi:ABC transporter permease [Bradyrhizobium sp. SSBR45G]|uniref:ABC transporter permease n=1 Tax=unclassified Bradyrhizobium TaxID=2631580 RepID=UPI0023429128|nr:MULTISPECIES: ABC transporter permease subunit [unclassified Bradyrhizobium]GLH80085.1 ABC transporter permease [Bradyrhizobium sp. SSBR45G]GLH87606.1 ABC transporter permease [Bradyrhizobium sp. SSBR45R]